MALMIATALLGSAFPLYGALVWHPWQPSEAVPTAAQFDTQFRLFMGAFLVFAPVFVASLSVGMLHREKGLVGESAMSRRAGLPLVISKAVRLHIALFSAFSVAVVIALGLAFATAGFPSFG